MIKFKSFSLKSVLSFKRVKVTFNGRIKRIFGLNLDARAECDTTGNGVGKSLLFSAGVSQPLYFQTPLTMARGKGAKDLFDKSSCVSLSFDNKKIIHSHSGFTLFEDGEDLKVRTVPLSKEKIRRWFPLSEEEFYTTVWVSSQVPYLIQRTTNVARLELFSNLFQLNDYGKLRDLFAQKLREVKDDEIAASVVQQSFNDKKKDLKTRPTVDTKSFKKLENELESLKLQVKKLTQSKYDLESFLSTLSSVAKIDAVLSKLRLDYAFKVLPEKALALLESQLEQTRERARYLEEFRSWSKETNLLKSRIGEIIIEDVQGDIEELQASKTKIYSKIRDLEKIENSWLENSKSRKSILAKLVDLGYSETNVPTKDFAHELSVQKNILELESLVHQHKSGKCPTCLSDIDISLIKRNCEAARSKIKTLTPKVKAQKLLASLPEDLDFNPKTLEVNREKLEKIENLINAWHEEDKKRSRLTDLKSRLKALTSRKPKKIEALDVSYDVREMHRLVSEVCSRLKQKSSLLKHLDVDSSFTIEQVQILKDKKQSELDSVLADLLDQEDRLVKLSSEYDNLNLNAKLRKSLVKELSDLKTKIQGFGDITSRKKIYQALVQTYGGRGLKIHVLKNICALYENTLNNYADLCFVEPMRFKLEVTETGCSILVTRPCGKTSDIRNMSGAESNSFVLLSSLSLLPLLPDSRRTNMIILDEPFCMCDTATRKKIIQSFFPALHLVVPNIVFISNTPEQVDGSEPFTVVKQDGKSELRPGLVL
jgi:DNA repair exonuclease SbcCD ATPase subunit